LQEHHNEVKQQLERPLRKASPSLTTIDGTALAMKISRKYPAIGAYGWSL